MWWITGSAIVTYFQGLYWYWRLSRYLGKKSNIVPAHKKGEKQIVNNYRPVSILPICSKILEKIIFDSIMRFLNKNKLLSDAQSGFRPSDSCEYQLLSIVHDIYKSFDCNPPLKVRGIFLDISKAFDSLAWWVDI